MIGALLGSLLILYLLVAVLAIALREAGAKWLERTSARRFTTRRELVAADQEVRALKSLADEIEDETIPGMPPVAEPPRTGASGPAAEKAL